MTDNFVSVKHRNVTNSWSLYEQHVSYKFPDTGISHTMWNLAAEQRFWVQTGENVGYETLTELKILYGALTSKKQKKSL